MKTQNYHVITVKYMGQTNTKPARVSIFSELFECRVSIPFTNEAGSTIPSLDTAELWLKNNGFDIVGHAEGNGHSYVITNTFKSLK